MSRKKTYLAVYERDEADDAWNVRVEGLDGCQTYGRSLRQAQARIREALAVWLDKEPETLVIRDQLPTSLVAVADSVARARRDAELAGTKAQHQTVEAVKSLTKLGLSRRDAAELLGLSHQRVQQLLDASWSQDRPAHLARTPWRLTSSHAAISTGSKRMRRQTRTNGMRRSSTSRRMCRTRVFSRSAASGMSSSRSCMRGRVGPDREPPMVGVATNSALVAVRHPPADPRTALSRHRRPNGTLRGNLGNVCRAWTSPGSVGHEERAATRECLVQGPSGAVEVL